MSSHIVGRAEAYCTDTTGRWNFPGLGFRWVFFTLLFHKLCLHFTPHKVHSIESKCSKFLLSFLGAAQKVSVYAEHVKSDWLSLISKLYAMNLSDVKLTF